MSLATLIRRLGLFALLAALALAAACGGDESPTPAGTPGDASPTAAGTPIGRSFPLEIERSDGKTLTLDEPASKIVSLSPGATESLYAIGAEDALVAVDMQADYPPEALTLATRVDAFEPNVEAIAALEPDLVIVASDTGGIVGALDRLEIPVLFRDINTDVLTIEDVFEEIETLGAVTGHDAEASAVVASLRARVSAVEDSLADLPEAETVTVFHELDSELYSAAENTFIGNLYVTLGAENIAGDGGGTPYPQLTNEAVIAADPDVIVLADEEFGVTIDSVKARPGWSAIAAVRDNRIVGIDPDIISRPGPRIVDALEQLARALYPEAS